MQKIIIGILFALSLSIITQASTFKDISENHWAADSVNKVVDVGIMAGYPDGTFKGGRPITRYELALYLNKVLSYVDTKNIMVKNAAADETSKQLNAELKSLKEELDNLKIEIAKTKKQ